MHSGFFSGFILLNSFRQLTLPWLVAVAAMGLLTGLWHHAEMTTQQRVQIEQFASTLQLSIAPLLKNREPELVRAQLNHLRYVSALPITALAVYDARHRLLAGTDSAAALQAFVPEDAVTAFAMQRHGLQVLVQLPLAESSTSGLQPDPERSGAYLLLLVTQNVSYSAWLVPLLIVAFTGLVVLKVLQNTLLQASSRLNTDISLLTHKLSQLCQGQHNTRVDEELVPELYPLKQALNDLVAAQSSRAQHSKTELQQLQLTVQQEASQCQSLQQQLKELQHSHQHLLQVVQLRLTNLRQLIQHSADMEAEQLQSALTGVTDLLSLEYSPQPPERQPANVTGLVAAVAAAVQQPLAARQIDIHIIEGEGLADYQVDVPVMQLQMLLVALLQLTARVSAASELVLRLRLSGDKPAVLEISVTCNGNGIPARVVQLLRAADTRPLQWHETDIGCVIAVRQQCSADMSVQSLDGLGSTVNIQLPVTARVVRHRQLQHILLFDSSALLPERIRSLNTVARNVVSCADIAELMRKSTQQHFELTLIFLPEPAELLQWQAVLRQAGLHGPCLCYAKAAELDIWRETLQRAIVPLPFCLSHLAATDQAAELPRLLVVDDNPTNLAFVRVLLKSQPVYLDMASSGAEALQLCRQQRFDIILLDIQLPDMAGTEVAVQLRQLVGYQHIPILAFTAHALDEEVAAFKQAGMDDVIFKPLDAGKLEQILYWCSQAKIDHAGQ